MLLARVQVQTRISFTRARTELRGFWNGDTVLLMSPHAPAVQLNNLCARCAVQVCLTHSFEHAKTRQLTHGCKPDEFFMTVTARPFSRHDRTGKQPFPNQAFAWSV
jgi:hypothetical protein